MAATKLNHDAMDQDVLSRSCSALNLKAGATIVATSAILMRHFAKASKKDELLKCERCGGLSDEKHEACPYCGEAGVNDNAQAEGTGGATPEGGKAVPAKSTKSKKPVAAKKPAAEKKPSAAKKPAAEKKPSAAAKPSKPKTVALALVETPNAQSREHLVLTEKDLDIAVEKILELKAASALSLWELGQKVSEVYDGELWVQRTNEGGRPRYKRFQQFCELELGLKRATAYALMEVSKNFDAKTLAEVGIKTLSIIVGLPPAQREPLLNAARGGASTREIQGAAAEARGAPESRDVSMMIRVGDRVVVPLVKAGERRGRHPVAHSLADHPWGIEKHENGITARYSIQAGEGGALELVIERRRGETETPA